MKPAHTYHWLLFDADGTLFDYDLAEAKALEGTFHNFKLPFHDTLSGYLPSDQPPGLG